VVHLRPGTRASVLDIADLRKALRLTMRRIENKIFDVETEMKSSFEKGLNLVAPPDWLPVMKKKASLQGGSCPYCGGICAVGSSGKGQEQLPWALPVGTRTVGAASHLGAVSSPHDASHLGALESSTRPPSTPSSLGALPDAVSASSLQEQQAPRGEPIWADQETFTVLAHGERVGLPLPQVPTAALLSELRGRMPMDASWTEAVGRSQMPESGVGSAVRTIASSPSNWSTRPNHGNSRPSQRLSRTSHESSGAQGVRPIPNKFFRPMSPPDRKPSPRTS